MKKNGYIGFTFEQFFCEEKWHQKVEKPIDQFLFLKVSQKKIEKNGRRATRPVKINTIYVVRELLGLRLV